MSKALAEPQSLTPDEFFSPENLRKLDQTLTEVFGMMLGCEIRAEHGADCANSSALPSGTGKIAIVNFAGAMRGHCEIRVNDPAALAVVSAMLGGNPPTEDVDNSMSDAVGELCNMVAGGWKNSMPSLESGCSLAPPTVRHEKDGHSDITPSDLTICRSYVFDTHRLRLTLRLETA